jgi:UDP-N-acetylmuramyl-tripeptide synthetase
MNVLLQMPDIYPVACHTDNIGAGSTFVAIKGQKEDGVQYIMQAVHKGATKIVVERSAQIPDDVHAAIIRSKVQLVYVDFARKALAELSAHALDYPAKKLKLVAVTGTKGKTTSAFLLEHVLRTAGYKTALLSTVKNKILDQEFKTNLTTQHPDYLHNFFALCVNASVEIVILEVAAQATSLHRVTGLELDGLIFTNFDQEHAEFYASMDEYFAAKQDIIKLLKPGAPLLLNADDAKVSALAQKYPHALLFGLHGSAHYKGSMGNSSIERLSMEVFKYEKMTDSIPPMRIEKNHEPLVNGFLVKQSLHMAGYYKAECSALVGTYNAYNVLGVMSLCLELGVAPELILEGLLSFKSVPGRLEKYILPNGASCFIDYAHNPSSYQAVLGMVRELTPHLIVVFGCGGDRDKSKRPLMGAIAAEYADLVILTSDNPRSENQQAIIDDIMEGIACDKHCKIVCDLDRERAIIKAYAHSKSNSVIMLLGKGPDEYQLIGSQKFHFSEKAIVQALQ